MNLLATIDKYQALEILYHAHTRAIEGVVGEGKSISWGGAQTKGEVHKRKLTKNVFLHSDLLTSLSSSLIPMFFMIKKLTLRNNEIKDRVILTNHIVLYARLTYVEPYQNIL